MKSSDFNYFVDEKLKILRHVINNIFGFTTFISIYFLIFKITLSRVIFALCYFPPFTPSNYFILYNICPHCPLAMEVKRAKIKRDKYVPIYNIC